MVKFVKDIKSLKSIRQTLCLTVFLILFSVSNSLANFSVHFPDNTHKTIKTKHISGQEYISLEQAGEILFFEKEYTVEKEVLFCQNNYLVAIAGSFFFDFSKHCQSYTIQMFMPITQHKEITYLPLEEFIYASIASGVLNGEYSGKQLTIQPYSIVELETYDFNTFDSPGIPLIADEQGIPNAGTYEDETSTKISILSNYTIKQLQVQLKEVEPNYAEMLKLKYERRKSKKIVPPNVFQIPEEIKPKETASNKSE